MSAEYDVIVIGAGPAGMSAALRLKQLGASVVVIDEQPGPGGQIWRGIERNSDSPFFTALGRDYQQGRAVAETFREAGIDYLPSTQVWQIEDGWSVFVTSHGEASRLKARAVVMAQGAQERPCPFPGWTLPGVMTVGAAQILLKSGGMLPEGKVWIAGCGPLPLLYATQLLELGGQLEGYIDTAPRPGLGIVRHLPAICQSVQSVLKGLKWQRELKKTTTYYQHSSGISAKGQDRLEQIEWTSGNRLHEAKADVLLVHEGIIPRIHETMALGCDHHWQTAEGALAPTLDEWRETSRQGIFVAGDAGGIGGWDAARITGAIAGLGAARRLGLVPNADTLRQQDRLDDRLKRVMAIRPFLNSLYPAPSARLSDETIVCRCEEVTAKRIRDVARTSAPDVGAIKAATRCGMGPCQGRQCGYSVQALVGEVNNIPQRDISFFNVRPPLKPVTLREIAGLGELDNAS